MIPVLLLAALLQVAQATPESAAEFARGLEAAVAKGEWITFDLALDPDAFYDRVVGATKLTPPCVSFLKPIVRTTLTSGPIFGVLKGRVTYKFLRARRDGGGFRALFRMTGEGAAFNYHELLLVPDAGGFRVVDYHVLNFGEFQSDLTRRVVMPSPQMLRILDDQITPTPDDFVADYGSKEINRLSQLFSAGRHQEALDFYRKAPALKHIRIAQVLHINAASSIGPAELEKAVGEMQEEFKDEPAVFIAAAGGYLRLQVLDKALEAIDRIEQAVGGDVFFNVMRANAHLGGKNPAKARELAQLVTDKEPTLDHGWWARIGAHLALKEFKDVARCLTLAERHLGVTFGDLSNSAGYSEFAKSPEYVQWLKEREGQ
jgi:hypothetical protein